MSLADGLTYFPHLRYDMSDEKVEELVEDVARLFTEEFDRRGAAELETPGIIDEVIDAVHARTSWGRSALQTPLRRAAQARNKRIDSFQANLVDLADSD